MSYVDLFITLHVPSQNLCIRQFVRCSDDVKSCEHGLTCDNVACGYSHRLVHIYSRYRTSYSRRMESCRHS